ncbi:MAG: DNA/RNA nuclease SfsA [Candidatus Helarchaeota archaeon]
MQIAKNILKVPFIERLNKFLGIVRLNNEEIKCFIPNLGRMKELLYKGKQVCLTKIQKKGRKTDFDLIAVEHEGELVSIDSRIPNKFVYNLLENKKLFKFEFDEIKPEYHYKNSRFDFFLRKNDKKYLIEVKSCTLVENSVALFPDAPTERGARHVFELIEALHEDYKAYIIFIIQRADADTFGPNEETDSNFSEKLKLAKKKGVGIKALTNKIFIRDNNLYIELFKEIKLNF